MRRTIRTSNPRAALAAALALGGLLAASGPVAGQDAGAADRGAALFLKHCAVCHGETGTGNGPMAPLLTIPVADLTAISARRDGSFPMSEVVQIIDGRLALRGHGGPMPVYGQVLDGPPVALDGPDGTVLETRGDIHDIAIWLQTIQVQAGE